VTERRVWWC